MERNLTVKLCNLHPAQNQILSEARRFNVLKCGRRFGKTELTKELSIQKMLDGFSVGYFTPTYKDLSSVWDEMKFTLHDVIDRTNEQIKHIKLITGGTLDMWSMEDPNSGRGRKYHRVIIDEGEKARHLKDAWEQTIRATLTDYIGDAWFMSTPKFGTTYFKETLFKNESRFADWKSWRFTSYDNPHLSKEEIDGIKNQLVDVVFRCEFMAEDVNLSYNRWAFAFDPARHIARHLDPMVWSGNHNEPLYLSFDFNRNPITCSVVQHYNGTVYFLEQIKLENSDIYKLCDYIIKNWGDFLYIVTGDASGKASSALVQDNRNFYTVIMEKLRVSGMQLKIPSVNPRLEENQVLVNSILQHYNVQIHPDKCKALIYDLENVSMNPDGSIVKENRQDPTQQADCLDCFTGDTLINTIDGQKRIDEIVLGDMVLTRSGYKSVIDKWHSEAIVYEVEFVDGTKIQCTKNHKYFTYHYGWYEIFRIFEENIPICKLQSFTAESNITSVEGNRISTHSIPHNIQDRCTGKNGSITSEKYQKDLTYIIKTATLLITKSRIMNWLTGSNTEENTPKKDLRKTPNLLKSFNGKALRRQPNGIRAKPGMNGTYLTLRNLISECMNTGSINANTVVTSLIRKQQAQGSVPIIASLHGEERISQIQNNASVPTAQKNIQPSNISQPNIALCNVRVKSLKEIGIRTVYDITVKDEHEFFAENILVHNCLRYYMNTFHKGFLRIKENSNFVQTNQDE